MPYGNDDPFARDELARRRQRQARIESMESAVSGNVSTLAKLQARGWTLTDADDLQAIEDAIAKVVRVYRPMEVGSVESELVHGARQAVRAERNRRDLENQRAIERQRDRIRDMQAAAKSFERALQLMGQAESIEDRRDTIPRATIQNVTAEGARAMEDVRLRQALAMEEHDGGCFVSGADANEHDAGVLERWGGAQGKRLAKVLRAIAKESREDAATHRANASVLRAEVDRRAELAKPVDVQALRARVAELEQAAASGTGEG